MSAFAKPVTRPLRLNEVTQLVSKETGEVTGWKGLNEDVDRCPSEFCESCPKRCLCAPCRCPECVIRDTVARGPLLDPEPKPRLQSV